MFKIREHDKEENWGVGVNSVPADALDRKGTEKFNEGVIKMKAVKVKELIDVLKTQNQDAIVLIASDDDGSVVYPLDLERGYDCGKLDDGFYATKNMSKEEEDMDFVLLYPRGE